MLTAFLERNTVNSSKNLDFSRFAPNFDDKIWLLKISFLDADIAKSEFLKDSQEARGVAFGYRHEKIDISSVTGKPVKRHRIATDYEILNRMFFE